PVFFSSTLTTDMSTLSLHDALPISACWPARHLRGAADRCAVSRGGQDIMSQLSQVQDVLLAEPRGFCAGVDRAIEIVERALAQRSEEHTSELQSRENLVCRLLLEKK